MITAWLAMTVAAVASTTIGSSAQSGYQQEEGVLDRLRAGEHQRALAEIVEEQRRQHQQSQAVWIGVRPKWPRSA